MSPSFSTTLLVIDETECPEADVFALVGLAVPIANADPVRLKVHRFMRELRGVPAGTISVPPELHGRSMLQNRVDAGWATDEHRIRSFAHVVEMVNELRLDVFRSAYYRKSLTAIQTDDPKRMMYSLCFGGLEQMASPLLAKSFVIPIMDGLAKDIVDPMSGSKPVVHAIRASPSYSERWISISNVENLLDPVFVDSRYSPLMQVADVAAHLLHILDWERAGLPLKGEFKPRVAAIARTLDMSLVHGAIPISMNMSMWK